jgi:hypothetical protein
MGGKRRTYRNPLEERSYLMTREGTFESGKNFPPPPAFNTPPTRGVITTTRLVRCVLLNGVKDLKS